jgi:glucose uptake protein
MILPQTYSAVLTLMIFSLLCWGSWANTFKLAGKYRFEMYYVDFAVGCLILALICAFTLGNLGFDGFSFLDDLEHAGKRQWLFAFIAGMIFNFANMLLTAAISVGGMAVAYPVGIGAAIIIGSALSYFIRPLANPALLFGGCLLIAASIVVVAIAYNIMGVIRHEELARAGKAKSTRRPTTVKGVVLAGFGGLMMGSFFPLVQRATEPEIGLGPYSLAVVFSLGILGSTVVLSMFFFNLPVEGDPIEIRQFFRTSPRKHLLGLLGGVIWCAGAVASFAASSAAVEIHLAPVTNYLLEDAFPLIAALWGILVWKELQRGDMRVKLLMLTMLILFAGGLALISVAPIPLRKG